MSKYQSAIDHMNDDHSANILDYVHAFGNIKNATAARMDDLTDDKMMITATTPDGDVSWEYTFNPPLGEGNSAHKVLVMMAKEAKQILSKS